MELADQYDYSVVNDDLMTAVAEVREMIEKKLNGGFYSYDTFGIK